MPAPDTSILNRAHSHFTSLWWKCMFDRDLTYIEMGSYSSKKKFVSSPILCMSFCSTLGFVIGLGFVGGFLVFVLFCWLGLVFGWFVWLFFLLHVIKGKVKSTVRQLWNSRGFELQKLFNWFYSSSLKSYHCRNSESCIGQCSSRAVKTEDYCYLAGAECFLCIKFMHIIMSNLSVAKEFLSTKKINKYSIQLLNTVKKNELVLGKAAGSWFKKKIN